MIVVAALFSVSDSASVAAASTFPGSAFSGSAFLAGAAFFSGAAESAGFSAGLSVVLLPEAGGFFSSAILELAGSASIHNIEYYFFHIFSFFLELCR